MRVTDYQREYPAIERLAHHVRPPERPEKESRLAERRHGQRPRQRDRITRSMAGRINDGGYPVVIESAAACATRRNATVRQFDSPHFGMVTVVQDGWHLLSNRPSGWWAFARIRDNARADATDTLTESDVMYI